MLRVLSRMRRITCLQVQVSFSVATGSIEEATTSSNDTMDACYDQLISTDSLATELQIIPRENSIFAKNYPQHNFEEPPKERKYSEVLGLILPLYPSNELIEKAKKLVSDNYEAIKVLDKLEKRDDIPCYILEFNRFLINKLGIKTKEARQKAWWALARVIINQFGDDICLISPTTSQVERAITDAKDPETIEILKKIYEFMTTSAEKFCLPRQKDEFVQVLRKRFDTRNESLCLKVWTSVQNADWDELNERIPRFDVEHIKKSIQKTKNDAELQDVFVGVLLYTRVRNPKGWIPKKNNVMKHIYTDFGVKDEKLCLRFWETLKEVVSEDPQIAFTIEHLKRAAELTDDAELRSIFAHIKENIEGFPKTKAAFKKFFHSNLRVNQELCEEAWQVLSKIVESDK